MSKLTNQEGKKVSEVEFPVRVNGGWDKWTTESIFKGKKVVVFGLPGAFTPTCSSSHLPRYEELYDTFKKQGIDEIYCVSVNDTFVMNSWAEAQEISKVKMLPDGNGDFTKDVGMLVDKAVLGFGERSWRYSMLIEDGVIVKHFIEPDKEGDPFEVSDADTMIKFINKDIKLPESVTVFTKKGCPFCLEAKELLREKGYQFSEIELSDAVRQKVLSGITGNHRPTAPQIFIEGNLVGGLDNLKKHFNI